MWDHKAAGLDPYETGRSNYRLLRAGGSVVKHNLQARLHRIQSDHTGEQAVHADGGWIVRGAVSDQRMHNEFVAAYWKRAHSSTVNIVNLKLRIICSMFRLQWNELNNVIVSQKIHGELSSSRHARLLLDVAELDDLKLITWNLRFKYSYPIIIALQT